MSDDTGYVGFLLGLVVLAALGAVNLGMAVLRASETVVGRLP